MPSNIVSYEKSAINEQSTTATTSEHTTQSDNTKRMSGKQHKLALEEFRQQFMQTPRIENRKPVFISETIRDDLDWIVRLFGERGMSVSGLVENLARNFLETYKEDVDNAQFLSMLEETGLKYNAAKFIKTCLFKREIKYVKLDKAAMDYYNGIDGGI